MIFSSSTSDDTQRLCSAFAANQTVTLKSGSTTRIDGTVMVNRAGACLEIEHGAKVIHNPTAKSCFEFNGAGSLVHGHGEIISNGTRNATNERATYAVVLVKGEKSTVRDIRLTGIPKVGVMFSEAGGSEAIDLKIDGQMPYSEWTGINTAHFGVMVDPDSGTHQGRVSVRGGSIENCVSGVILANYGDTTLARGLLVNGVRFGNCHDHGVYADGANGANISGNNFDECCVAVVAGGAGLVVSGNSMTNFNTPRGMYDRPGISIRDAQNCVISSNSVIGGFGQAGYVAIAIDNFYQAVLSGNIISNNTIINNGQFAGGAIRLGSDLTEYSQFNTLQGNIIDGVAGDWDALVRVSMKAGYLGYGNALIGNQIINRNSFSPMFLNRQFGMHVNGNRMEILHSAASPTTSIFCGLDDVRHSSFMGNSFNCGYSGGNLHLRAINSLNSHNNFYSSNRMLATAAGILSAHGLYSGSPSCTDVANGW